MGWLGKNKKAAGQKLNNAEIYLNYLELMFGKADVIRRMEAKDCGPAIHIFYYHDLPEKGMLTAITYGLSIGDHPDWVNGKCELMVSLNTKDESWGMAAAFFAGQYRGEKAFNYGSLFTLDEPISPESAMSGYFVFAPSFLERHQTTLVMPDFNIFFKGLYPIYQEEIEVYYNIGLEAFWHHANFDMYNIKRPQITT